MRRSAPFSVDLPRAVAWSAFVVAMLLSAVFGLVAWLFLAADLADPAVWAGLAASLLVLLLALPAAAVSPVRLQWDGELWHLRPLDERKPAERAGHLQVMLDLSVAMLLRFSPDMPGPGHVQWIPVQRSHLGASWRAFRRTVYSSSTLPGGKPSGDRPHTETTRPD